MLDEYYRGMERDAIRDCLENYTPFSNMPPKYQTDLVVMLEQGCNNHTFDKALERNIPKIWDEDRYVEQYSNIGYHLKVNLDPESAVNSGKTDTEKTYLANMVCNNMLYTIITEK